MKAETEDHGARADELASCSQETRCDGPRRGPTVSDHQINFLGWILFVLSAIAFVIASIGSFWSLVGSLFFLVACLVFLIPFFR